MLKSNHIHLADVQAVYSGPEGRLWELLMGEQIHLGGLESSMDLSARAGIRPGQCGVDLCCASGAGMRFLLRFRGVARMTGVDATPAMLELARRRAAEEGLENRMFFREANVCDTGLQGSFFDFVWGEDAWCYVEDKSQLIGEAARLARTGGTIAFTDWMEATVPMTATEADRLLKFMKFPALLSLEDYTALLRRQRCRVETAMDTGRFAPLLPLYVSMIEKQLTYDALRLIRFDQDLAANLVQEMRFLQALAEQGKIIQGLIVARKE